MNARHFIKAELEAHGKPIGLFLVINSDGQVVHVAESFENAVKWIEELDDTPPQRAAQGQRCDCA